MSILGENNQGPYNLIIPFDSIIDLVEFVEKIKESGDPHISEDKGVRDFDRRQEEIVGPYCILDSMERGGNFYRLIATRLRRVFKEEVDPVPVEIAAEA